MAKSCYEYAMDILARYPKTEKELSEDITEGIQQRIAKEIQLYKKKWVDGFEIIQKLMRKGYRLADIKSVIKPQDD